MGRKKKVVEPEPVVELDVELLCQIDDVYICLTEKYFELAPTEKFGLTKDLTKKLDKLEAAIRARKEELIKTYVESQRETN